MAGLADLIPLVEQARRLGVPEAQIPAWIVRLNQFRYQGGAGGYVPLVTGQQEIERERQALLDRLQAESQGAASADSLARILQSDRAERIQREADPFRFTQYLTDVSSLPAGAAANPVAELIGRGVTIKPQLPEDPRYNQTLEDLFQFGRRRMSPPAVPAASAGKDIILDEPVVGVGAYSGRPRFTAAENGPERAGGRGGVRFTPQPGVSRAFDPERQAELLNSVSVPGFADGGLAGLNPAQASAVRSIARARQIIGNRGTRENQQQYDARVNAQARTLNPIRPGVYDRLRGAGFSDQLASYGASGRRYIGFNRAQAARVGDVTPFSQRLYEPGGAYEYTVGQPGGPTASQVNPPPERQAPPVRVAPPSDEQAIGPGFRRTPLPPAPGFEDFKPGPSPYSIVPLPSPPAGPSSGAVSPAVAGAQALGRALQYNPFAPRELIDALMAGTPAPPQYLTQRLRKNIDPYLWQALLGVNQGFGYRPEETLNSAQRFDVPGFRGYYQPGA